MEIFKKFLIALLFLAIIAPVGAWCDDNYIDPDVFDLEKIREEHQELSENCVFRRVYIFLAVLNGESYDAYATRGSSDPDNDGMKAMEDPNDLKEYESIGEFGSKLTISGDKRICYITGMPNFDQLFPNEKDPFEGDTIIGIPTEAQVDKKHVLSGSKTLPLFSSNGDNVGIDRFVAFYNKVDPANKKEGVEDNQVTSYGFIEIQIHEAE